MRLASLGGQGGNRPGGNGSLKSPLAHASRTSLACNTSCLTKAINAIRTGMFRQIHHIRRPNVVGEYGVSIGCVII